MFQGVCPIERFLDTIVQTSKYIAHLNYFLVHLNYFHLNY